MSEAESDLSPQVVELLAVLSRSRNEEWYQWVVNGRPKYTKEEYEEIQRKRSKKILDITRAKIAQAKRAQEQME